MYLGERSAASISHAMVEGKKTAGKQLRKEMVGLGRVELPTNGLGKWFFESNLFRLSQAFSE
jgi:hypothetical protein